MKWTWIKYHDSVGHMVSEQFLDAVSKDLESRDMGDLVKMEEHAKFHLDLPGMMIADRPIEHVCDLDGLSIECPSTLVADFITILSELKVRSGGYVKLHGFYFAMVLSPEQRDSLVASLKSIADMAEKNADDHHKLWLNRISKVS